MSEVAGTAVPETHGSAREGRRTLDRPAPEDWIGAAPIFALGAGLAFALKRFYAGADAEALDFVLGPTAALAGAMSGVAFEAEAGVGYVSRDSAYLIVPACAGLNFTIAAFGSLLVGFLPRWRSGRERVLWLACAIGIAGVVTPCTNALRIALDVALRRHALPDWLSRADAHRIEGIVVYLGTLALLQVATARVLTGPRSTATWRSSRWTIAVPLASYLVVALGLPWLRGAGARPGFDHHAWVVLSISLVLTGLLAALLRRSQPIEVSFQTDGSSLARSEGASRPAEVSASRGSSPSATRDRRSGSMSRESTRCSQGRPDRSRGSRS